MSLFSQEQLAKIIDETLPPTAERGEHVVIGTVDKSGAQIVAVMRFNQHWEVQGAWHHDWAGEDSAAAKVIARW